LDTFDKLSPDSGNTCSVLTPEFPGDSPHSIVTFSLELMTRLGQLPFQSFTEFITF